MLATGARFVVSAVAPTGSGVEPGYAGRSRKCSVRRSAPPRRTCGCSPRSARTSPPPSSDRGERDPFALRDPAYIERTLPAVRLASQLYFRADVRGLAHIPPEGPVLLVGNHSGGTLIADTFVFGQYFYDHFGAQRRFHQLAHDLVFKVPGLRALRRALRDGPGLAGQHGRGAPPRRRAARLPGRRPRDLPPVVGIGPDRLRGPDRVHQARAEAPDPDRPGGRRSAGRRPHCSSAREAARSGAPARPRLRLKVLPAAIGPPFGLTFLDLPGRIPLPAKISIRVLKPIDLRDRLGARPGSRRGLQARHLDHAAHADQAVERTVTSRRGVSRHASPGRRGSSLLALAWGSTFLFIKIGDEALAPFEVSLGRLLVGTATLLAILAAARRAAAPRTPATLGSARDRRDPPERHPVHAVRLRRAARLERAGRDLERHRPAVHAPDRDRSCSPTSTPPPGALAGLGVGFAGVLVVLGVWRGSARPRSPATCCASAPPPPTASASPTRAGTWPAAARDRWRSPPRSSSAPRSILAILAPLFSPAPHGVAAKHVLSVLALGVFGTGLTFVLNYSLIRDVGATVTSTVTYVIPIVSTRARRARAR